MEKQKSTGDLLEVLKKKSSYQEGQEEKNEQYSVNLSEYLNGIAAQKDIGLDTVKPVVNSMGDPLKTKTITLSCGKLTTGVTVKPWTGIFMLRNLKSPETYFQSAFRVQSPWVVKNENGEDEIMKR